MTRVQYLLIFMLLSCCINANQSFDVDRLIAGTTISSIPADGSGVILIYNVNHVGRQAVLERYEVIRDTNGNPLRFDEPEIEAGVWAFKDGFYYFTPVRSKIGLSLFFGETFNFEDLERHLDGDFKLRHINRGREEILIQSGDDARLLRRFNSGKILKLEDFYLIHDVL